MVLRVYIGFYHFRLVYMYIVRFVIFHTLCKMIIPFKVNAFAFMGSRSTGCFLLPSIRGSILKELGSKFFLGEQILSFQTTFLRGNFHRKGNTKF